MTNVRDFGAVGDGSTDDSGSIQHAVEQGDGELVFPRGVYKLSRSIEVSLRRFGPVSIAGSGGTARLVMSGPGPALRLVGTHTRSADPGEFQSVVWERERMPTVSALEIEGANDQAEGIVLEGTMQATLTGILIRRCRVGVHLVKRNRNFLLANSHIYHGRPGGVGVYFEGVNLHQANIVGCHISYCPHAGIKVEQSEVRNLQISGCDIEYNFDTAGSDSADVWIDAREGTVREGTIVSNTIQAKESPGGANVRIEGPANESSKGAGLWTITGNILQSQAVNLLLRSCRGVSVTGNSFASAFHRSIIVDRCRHVVIGPNTFDHNPDYPGARIDGITIRQSSGCTVSGLMLEDTRAGSQESGGAIEIADSSEIAITGCQVLDPEHRGIDLSNTRNCRVTDCTVVDRRPTPTMRDAIRMHGRHENNMIQQNLLGKGTRTDLLIEE